MDSPTNIKFSTPQDKPKDSWTLAGSRRTCEIKIDSVAMESFSCRVAATGFGSTLRNLNLKRLIWLKHYVALEGHDDIFVRKEKNDFAQTALATLTDAVAISTHLKTNIQTLKDKNLPALIQSSYEFFRQNATILPSIYLHAKLVFTDVEETSMYNIHREQTENTKSLKRWKVSLIAKGGSTTTINTLGAEQVTKLLRFNTQSKNSTLMTYTEMKDRQVEILSALSPSNTTIEPPLTTIFSENNKTKTITLRNAQGADTTISGFASHSPAFEKDWTHRSFDLKQFPSMCAQIVQESKNFLIHGIFHLEVKTGNLLYKEDTTSTKERSLKAKHTDFLDAINTNTSNWKSDRLLFTPCYTCVNDVQNLSDNKFNNELTSSPP